MLQMFGAYNVPVQCEHAALLTFSRSVNSNEKFQNMKFVQYVQMHLFNNFQTKYDFFLVLINISRESLHFVSFLTAMSRILI